MKKLKLLKKKSILHKKKTKKVSKNRKSHRKSRIQNGGVNLYLFHIMENLS